MSIDLRPVSPDGFAAFHRAAMRSFGEEVRDAERDAELWTFEFERSLAVYDRGEPVATAGAFTFELTVPGGPAPAAGVTWVGVLPTHRRRGLLTAMMDRQLTDLHDNGEPVAALWASEGGIYGRYGYGLAAWHGAVELRRGETAFRPVGTAPDVALRFREADEALPDLTAVFERVRPSSVGFVSRGNGRWRTRLWDPEHRRNGSAPLSCVVAESADGGADGYVLFATKPSWSSGLPAGELSIRELFAATPAASAALWRFILDVDLVASVRSEVTPLDDPLLHLLAEPRRARLRASDNLWIRLVDVGRALAARSYAGSIEVVLDVTDGRCPWNTGRWRLSGDADGARCESTSDPADLTLPVDVLGAAYLGGPTLASLAAAGRVEELRPGALLAASRAFAGDRPPFCPEVF